MEGIQEVTVPAAHIASPWGNAGSSPWNQGASPVPCSLEDVMSEQLASKLQEEEEKCIGIGTQDQAASGADNLDPRLWLDEEDSTGNDEMLAQMLQTQFDLEHDKQLQREEAKYNGPSKVTLSYNKYRVSHPSLDDEEEEEAEEWPEDSTPDNGPKFNKMGIAGKGQNMVSKHDAAICGKKNANKMMEFAPGMSTGDAVGIDMRLSNKVYNSLKQHSIAENKRSMRIHEKKEHSTAEMAVDEKTRLLLYKLMNQGVLQGVNGIISTGKESVVLHADGGSMSESSPVPSECAIKVFKTTLTDFKNRAQYVKGDVRFFKDEFKKQNPRKIIKIWADKEEFNLRRLGNVGLPVPRVIVLKKHVLVMEFLGQDRRPASKLKEARLGPADMELAYEQCIENMRRMYREAGLVHADLSPYNILWHRDQAYFIDVSQAVEKMHPHALEFLLRDCTNMSRFFKKSGVPKVMDEYTLFNYVTGLDLKGEGVDFLAQVDDYEKNEERLRLGTGKDYAFDHYFELAQKERAAAAGAVSSDDDDDNEEENDEEQEEANDATTTQTREDGDEDGDEDGGDKEEAGEWQEVTNTKKHRNRKQ